MSKRQREDAPEGALPHLYLLSGASNEDPISRLGPNLQVELQERFSLQSGTFDELLATYPDPTLAPLVFVGTIAQTKEEARTTKSDSLLEIASKLDHHGYRRTGAAVQSMCVANDRGYFGAWATSRGVRKPGPVLSNVASKPAALPCPVVIKRAAGPALPVHCDTYGALNSVLQQFMDHRLVIEPVVEGPHLTLLFIAEDFCGWYESPSAGQTRPISVKSLAELPRAVASKLFVFRAFAQEMDIQDALQFDLQLDINDDHNNDDNNDNHDDNHNNNSSGAVHVLEASVVGDCLQHFTREQSEIYVNWLATQTAKRTSVKSNCLNPSDYQWEVIVEGDEQQHAYEKEVELTRTVLGVSADNWRVHWVKSPATDCKTVPHVCEGAPPPQSPLHPARSLNEIVTSLLQEFGLSSHSSSSATAAAAAAVASFSPSSPPASTTTSLSSPSPCSSLSFGAEKPRCIWFLYDYNDGLEHLSRLQQCPRLTLIAPSVESYEVSSSKVAMKRRFVRDGVPTAPYTERVLTDPADFMDCPPWFVKPDGSFASIGIYKDNKVKTPEEMKRVWERTEALNCGVFAEHFLRGRECTVLVCGPIDRPLVFNPVERVFDSGLSGHQEDNNWDNFHFVALQDGDGWGEACKLLAKAAYRAIDAAPYARVDIRGNFVLEVNTVPAYSLTDLAYSLAKSLNGDPANWKLFWQRVWEARRQTGPLFSLP